MAIKTVETEVSVADFINAVPNEQQRLDSWKLVEWMKDITGSEAKMWGPSIIGFGKYHYKYPSGHGGAIALLGFSPRKGSTSLYIYSCESDESEALLSKLGKFKMGKACIYIKKLSDIDEQIFRQIAQNSIEYTRKKYIVE